MRIETRGDERNLVSPVLAEVRDHRFGDRRGRSAGIELVRVGEKIALERLRLDPERLEKDGIARHAMHAAVEPGGDV